MGEAAPRRFGWRGVLGVVVASLAAVQLLWVRDAPAPVPVLLLTLAPANGDASSWSSAGKGELIARFDVAAPRGEPHTLVADFAYTGLPSPSYDGARAVFSGRRHGDEAMRIWEIALRGSAPRAITGGADCYDPVYLPDDRVVFARALQGEGANPGSALYVIEPATEDESRITFGDEQDRNPAVLADGRVVFRRQSGPHAGSGRLLAVNTDGTGVQLFCPPADGWSIDAGPWVVGERVVFAESRGDAAGQRLVSVLARAPRGEPKIVVPVASSGSDTWFSSVSTHPEGGLVTAAWEKGRGWGLHRIASESGSVEPPLAAVALPVFDGSLRPAGLAVAVPRPRPLRLTSVVDEQKSTGTLLCLDVGTSQIPAVAGAAEGTVRRVRVRAADGTLMGEAPVQTDGSFFVEVPANQPLQLELYGPDGVLARDHSLFWVRPNENRGCIGCHEDPDLAPENRVALALNRAATVLEATHAGQ